jgi:hypothetical protein
MTKTQQPTMMDPDDEYLAELVSWSAEPSRTSSNLLSIRTTNESSTTSLFSNRGIFTQPAAAQLNYLAEEHCLI